jgi:ribosomal protein S27AE
MRFPHPVTETCPTCGQPTVLAETWNGSVLRVHCGTWSHRCDTGFPASPPRGVTVADELDRFVADLAALVQNTAQAPEFSSRDRAAMRDILAVLSETRESGQHG